MIETNVSETDLCLKCGTRTLERDPEGDIHCWGCGSTFMQKPSTPAGDTPPAQRTKAAIALRRPIVTFLEKTVAEVGGLSAAKIPKPKEMHYPIKAMRRGRRQGTKIGHYSKTAGKVGEVIRLYNGGYGIRPIMQKLSLAGNTVKGIIQENSQLINHVVAKELRRKRVKQQKESIILALKGLAGSAKSSNHSYEWMLEGAGNILAIYMKRDPVGTVESLVGNKPFGVDDLFKKTYEIILGQRLRLDNSFIEVEEGVFKLVNS